MSSRIRPWLLLAPLSLSLSLACSKTSDLELGPKFPEAETLERIAASPAQPQSNATASRRVPLWNLEQPLPTEVGVGPALGDSPGEQLLTALVAADPSFQIDEQLTCAAHQLARYVAVNRSAPTHALLRYMVHRCGTTTPTYGWTFQPMPAAPQLADLQRLLGGGDGGRVGVWVVQERDQWVLAALRGHAKAMIEPLPMTVEGGQVTISGLLGERAWIMGHVTLGESAVGVCQSLPDAPGGFRLVCPVDPADPGAYIDIFAAAPGRVLGDHEARIWVSPNRSLDASFADPAHGRPARSITGALEVEFVTAVNEVRTRAGMVPLMITPTQSEIAKSIRPHFRAARAGGDGQLLDDIVLGLMAGWELDEPILDGNFAELEFESVSGREHLLESALSQPGLRASLLDPRASRIAITVDEGKPGEIRAGMFATYSLAERGERAAEQKWLFDLFDLARRTRNLPSLTPLTGASEALADTAARIAGGMRDVEEGLDEALTEIAEQNPGRQIQGAVVIVQDVRQVEVPPEIMAAGNLDFAIHVELIESSKSPWASLLIVYAYAPRT
jgi:hypothetical protein